MLFDIDVFSVLLVHTFTRNIILEFFLRARSKEVTKCRREQNTPQGLGVN